MGEGMKTLHLTLKKHWFDMSHPDTDREKRKDEEYREIKQYWIKRLEPFIKERKPFRVVARNGYQRDSPVFERICYSIGIDFPVPRWMDGNTRKLYFTLHYTECFLGSRWCKMKDLDDEDKKKNFS